VLHVSVAARWWLRHPPHAALGERPLFDLVPRRATRFLVHPGIEARVLDELALDLAGAGFDETIIATLADDVARQFELFYEHDFAYAIGSPETTRRASNLAVAERLAFYDAQTVVLAESTSIPLLVADVDQYAVIERIAGNRPALQTLWLPDYLPGGSPPPRG
jgi:hypothetical protein